MKAFFEWFFDRMNGGRWVFALIATLLAIAFAQSLFAQGVMVRDKKTNDSTMTTSETTLWIPDGAFDAMKGLRREIDSLRREISAIADLVRLGQERQSKFITAAGERLRLQDKLIQELQYSPYDIVLSATHLVSNTRPRQHYSVGFSYAFSPRYRAEGSVLAGLGDLGFWGDVGAKAHLFLRQGQWELGVGGIYRSHGVDATLEDSKYLAASLVTRHYFGAPYIEFGIAREWQLPRREYRELQNGVGIGIGFGLVL